MELGDGFVDIHWVGSLNYSIIILLTAVLARAHLGWRVVLFFFNLAHFIHVIVGHTDTGIRIPCKCKYEIPVVGFHSLIYPR